MLCSVPFGFIVIPPLPTTQGVTNLRNSRSQQATAHVRATNHVGYFVSCLAQSKVRNFTEPRIQFFFASFRFVVLRHWLNFFLIIDRSPAHLPSFKTCISRRHWGRDGTLAPKETGLQLAAAAAATTADHVSPVSRVSTTTHSYVAWHIMIVVVVVVVFCCLLNSGH